MRITHGTLLAAVLPLVAGEMLVIEDVPCPDQLPDEACFLTTNGAGPGAYENVALPMDITVEYVQDLLQAAIKVEHGTIPLYLTTLYSVQNQSSFAAVTIKSVVMEEMLHMVQAANVLNAIGGHPFLDRPDFIPEYPLILPLINVSASITWFARQSVAHYQILESVPPAGYNTSISAAYLHIVNTLEALVEQHGEENIFTGDPKLQVQASLPNGQTANPVLSMQNATFALLGVGDQGGGCPVPGKPWPEYVNISAGPLGSNYSHSARYTEILKGREYSFDDEVGQPTGPAVDVNWTAVRKFTPNPTVSDFLPEQCVAGGAWVLRNESFFVSDLFHKYGRLANYTTDTWEECANLCMAWTIDDNEPLDPCAMWSWQNSTENASVSGIPHHMCLLGQQWTPPNTQQVQGLISGCQFGSVCNNSLPLNAPPTGTLSEAVLRDDPPPAPLAAACKEAHAQHMAFAGNYTQLLVALHNVFNGQPDQLMNTLMQMYQLKSMAQALMETDDPRIPESILGIGPAWEYVPNASHYERRGREAVPILTL